MFIWQRWSLRKSSHAEAINVEAEVVYFVNLGEIVGNEEVYQFSVDEHEAFLIIVLK